MSYAINHFIQPIVSVDLTINKYEILARPVDCDTDLQTYFNELDAESSFAVFMEQIHIAEQIFDKYQVPCSINISGPLIHNEAVRQKVLGICLAFQHILKGLEFSEKYELPPPEQFNEFLQGIRATNISIILDDFGTGEAGFGSISDYSFDEVKLDRELIHDIQHREHKVNILKQLANMLNVLNFTTTIEGIENQTQLDMLSSIGFEFFQGFHLGRPFNSQELLYA